MSLTVIAVLNGALVAALLAALVYVCRIPYRLDRRSASVQRLVHEPVGELVVSSPDVAVADALELAS